MLKQAIKAVIVLSMSFGLLAGCEGGKPEKAGEKAATAVKTVEGPAAENAARQAAAPVIAGEKIEIEIHARLDGKPAAEANVSVDGAALGKTDEKGYFLGSLQKKPGEEIAVGVSKEAPGFSVVPWVGSFVVKLPKDGKVERYSFQADLKASMYVTVAVSEKGKPVEGADVAVKGKKAGTTDKNGEFLYEYETAPKKGVEFSVSKAGFAPWSMSVRKLTPGQKIEAALSKRTVIDVSCLTDDYGRSAGVAGVVVSVDGEAVGKTDAKGASTYRHAGKPGKKIRLTLSAPGYIPAEWETPVTLQGEVKIQRFFYPATPRPIRTGIYGYTSNSPGADLKDILTRTEEAVSAQLYKHSAFREVPPATLQSAMKKAKLPIEKATAKGWRNSPIAASVDMIVVGSVTKDDKGFLIETRFHNASGKTVLSLIERAKGAGDIVAAAKEIAVNAVERFPFEGTVVAAEEDRYRINLGKAGHRVVKGTEFDLAAPVIDRTGKVTGHRETGILKVNKVDESGAWAAVENLNAGEKISVGDRVVRYVPREGADGDVLTLSVKGGKPPDVSALPGVNVYFNGAWIGSTGPDGKTTAPVRLGKSYNLLLYRQGYGQFSDTIRAGAAGETKEFVLAVNNSLFKVDSEPSGADVVVDGTPVGKTPIADGKLFPLGFHTVRVSAGADYRDFEEVMEFSRDVEDRTGSRRIVLFKDYLGIGGRAAKAGNLDAAIQAYGAAPKEHPDYSEIHGRLGKIYLDEKNDYGAAIREFESVLSLPANRQLIYKQFAVMFANLGHAYYEEGNQLVNRDKEAASRNLTKALQNLQTARQNMRFFPTQRYEEAVHDTHYYTALSYHKLYLMTRKASLLDSANNAWRDYFDFFPAKLEGVSTFEQSRQAARKYQDQLRETM
ncbi:MAG: PEGA domain-containing protein [Candidatus Deferrimicrobiaceae bacterium]